MRADLNKVLTEQPRRGSASPHLKTRARFKTYDDSKEDRYSLPKQGKMLLSGKIAFDGSWEPGGTGQNP